MVYDIRTSRDTGVRGGLRVVDLSEIAFRVTGQQQKLQGVLPFRINSPPAYPGEARVAGGGQSYDKNGHA